MLNRCRAAALLCCPASPLPRCCAVHGCMLACVRACVRAAPMPAVLLRCHAAVLTRHRAAPLVSPLLRCYAAPMQCGRAAIAHTFLPRYPACCPGETSVSRQSVLRCHAAVLPLCRATVLPRCQPRCCATVLPRGRAAMLPRQRCVAFHLGLMCSTGGRVGKRRTDVRNRAMLGRRGSQVMCGSATGIGVAAHVSGARRGRCTRSTNSPYARKTPRYVQLRTW